MSSDFQPLAPPRAVRASLPRVCFASPRFPGLEAGWLAVVPFPQRRPYLGSPNRQKTRSTTPRMSRLRLRLSLLSPLRMRVRATRSHACDLSPAAPTLPDWFLGRSGVVHNASPVPTAIRGSLYREVTALASAAAALHESHQVSASMTPGGETLAYSLEGTAGMLAELNEARVLLETKVGAAGMPGELNEARVTAAADAHQERQRHSPTPPSSGLTADPRARERRQRCGGARGPAGRRARGVDVGSLATGGRGAVDPWGRVGLQRLDLASLVSAAIGAPVAPARAAGGAAARAAARPHGRVAAGG